MYTLIISEYDQKIPQSQTQIIDISNTNNVIIISDGVLAYTPTGDLSSLNEYFLQSNTCFSNAN